MTQATIREALGRSGVFVGAEVDAGRIAQDAVIHPGCRISGPKTSIGPGCIIGAEGPATLQDCRLGRGVELKGGLFSGATFLDGSVMGPGAHVRPGTLLEEESGGAHGVGFKQTILLPFVTAGSLINFCDALMAGGTSRKNHSEIGSSYVHFNFTPHQDKATASLLGDVPNGVFLDNSPIFLGGQGGLVGPTRLAFGTVVAAGSICRKDILQQNQLHVAAAPSQRTIPYDTAAYGRISRIVRNNLVYIGNLMALQAWYRVVRGRFMNRDPFDRACHEGALENLDLILKERIKRMEDLAGRLGVSIDLLSKKGGSREVITEQEQFVSAWPTIVAGIEAAAPGLSGVAQESRMPSLKGGDYLAAVKAIGSDERESGRAWLQSIVDGIEKLGSN